MSAITTDDLDEMRAKYQTIPVELAAQALDNKLRDVMQTLDVDARWYTNQWQYIVPTDSRNPTRILVYVTNVGKANSYLYDSGCQFIGNTWMWYSYEVIILRREMPEVAPTTFGDNYRIFDKQLEEQDYVTIKQAAYSLACNFAGWKNFVRVPDEQLDGSMIIVVLITDPSNVHASWPKMWYGYSVHYNRESSWDASVAWSKSFDKKKRDLDKPANHKKRDKGTIVAESTRQLHVYSKPGDCTLNAANGVFDYLLSSAAGQYRCREDALMHVAVCINTAARDALLVMVNSKFDSARLTTWAGYDVIYQIDHKVTA